MTGRWATPRRGRGSRGAAMVEMALVAGFLMLLLCGIIAYGYLMSFRGSMAQSAAEGARAAATAPRPEGTEPGGFDNSLVIDRAEAATAQAVGGFGRDCGARGLGCEWVIHDCSGTNDTAAVPDCMTVNLTYANRGATALPLAELPLLSQLIPDELNASSTVQLNDQ
ncbi:MAG: TadE family protein [Acidimicrobiales bacterium]